MQIRDETRYPREPSASFQSWQRSDGPNSRENTRMMIGRLKWHQRGVGTTHSSHRIRTNAAGKPKPKDHIDKKSKSKEVVMQSESSKYADIIEREAEQQQPPTKTSSSATITARKIARVESAIASGLGGLMGGQVLLQLAAEEEKSKQQTEAFSSSSVGSESIESLTAKLADKGFDLDNDWGSATIASSTTAQQKQATSTISSLELLKPPSNAKFTLERREDSYNQRNKRRLLFSSSESESESDDEAKVQAAANRLYNLPPPPTPASQSKVQESKADNLKGLDTLLQEVLRASKEEERAATALKGPRGSLPPMKEKESKVSVQPRSGDESSLETAQWDLIYSLPSQELVESRDQPLNKASSQSEAAAMMFARMEAEEAKEEAEMQALMMKVWREKSGQASTLHTPERPSRSSMASARAKEPKPQSNLSPKYQEPEDDLLSIAAGGWQVAKARSSKKDALVRPQLQSDRDEAQLRIRRPQSENGWIQEALSGDKEARRRGKREEEDEKDIFVPPPTPMPQLKRPPPPPSPRN
jgi:hypothetical protein